MKHEDVDSQKKSGVKKSVFGVSMILVALLSVMGTLLVTDALNDPATPSGNQQSSTSVSTSNTKTPKNFETLEEVYSLLQQKYYEEVDPETLIEGAISGMAESVGDPYTEYLDEQESSSLSEDISGSFEGIGAEVMKEGEAIKIVSPIADSPAEKAGLLTNDLILSIDGESVADLSLTEGVALIRGPKGTDVTLSVKRGENVFDVTVTRDSIPIETVRFNLDKEDASVGYIRITNFSQPTYEELVDAVTELRSQGATSFVFDVRGNPGGLLNVAIQMSNMFVKEGETLVRVEERGKETLFYNANDAQYGSFKVTEPSVLLIDEGSASASEILAGAMNESAGIPLIGMKTFGKGTIQNIQLLQGTGELKLTIGKWLTPEGNWIHDKGIEPTVKSELPSYVHLLLIDSSKTYAKDDMSAEVANLEAVLEALGYSPGEPEGLFDAETEDAVKKFQSDNGLNADGKVTGKTSTLLVEQLRELIEENDTQYKAAKETLKKQ